MTSVVGELALLRKEEAAACSSADAGASDKGEAPETWLVRDASQDAAVPTASIRLFSGASGAALIEPP